MTAFHKAFGLASSFFFVLMDERIRSCLFALLICSTLQPIRSASGVECCAAATLPVARTEQKPGKMAFIIGAQKSGWPHANHVTDASWLTTFEGTTYLFDELVGRHPKISSQQKLTTKKGFEGGIKQVKEPQYFAEHVLREFDEYLAPFRGVGEADG